jgi:hypothetical protein
MLVGWRILASHTDFRNLPPRRTTKNLSIYGLDLVIEKNATKMCKYTQQSPKKYLTPLILHL